MIKTSAPGKVILFGEHAVVYGKLGIATAIDIRVQSQIEKSKSIIVENIGTFRITPEQLEEINIAVSTLINKHNFSLLSSMLKDDQNLCTKYIISEIVKNIEPEPFKLKNTSTLRKGMGGSSAAFSAEIKALAEFYGLRNFTRKKISELAYKGDIIAHGGTPSGIDNSTVTFGGYIAFRKETGPEMLDIESKMRIVIGDTKRPANTGQTVSMVRSRVEKGDRKAIAAIDDIDEISSRALDTIKSQDLVKLGELMDENQEKLRVLGVSSPELEALIAAAKHAGAFGAKLSGGGGGGIMIALCDEHSQHRIARAIEEAGGEAIITQIGVEGVRRDG